MFIGALSTSHTASAGGKVGGAGNPGGCSGSCVGQPYTSNGYGWYKFNSSGSGPVQFKQGGTWASVSASCRNTGNNEVIAFIVQRPSGGPTNATVYNYSSSSFGTYNKYLGNSGGNWLSYGTAKARYDAISPALKTGYTWGSNVAWFCYSSQSQWTVRANSYIKKSTNTTPLTSDSGWTSGNITAAPNNVLYYKHTLQARDARVDKRISWSLRGTGFPSNFALNNTGSITGSSGVGQNQIFAKLGNYSGANASSTVYQVRQSDVGRSLCQYIQWTPRAWNSSGNGTSNDRCATIPYNFSLNPFITDPPNDRSIESEQGEITVNGTIRNDGPTKSRTNIPWQITRLDYVPGASITQLSGGTGANPCQFFVGESACDPLDQGTVNSGFGYPDQDDFSASTTIGTSLIGTRICFVISVQNYREGTSTWRHSPLSCPIIGKKPKIQVTGSDVIVGRAFLNDTSGAQNSSIQTSISAKVIGGSPQVFGSWGEYGAVAAGSVTNFGTGSAFAGSGASGGNTCQYNGITVANVAVGAAQCSVSSPTLGNYSTTNALPDVARSFPTNSAVMLSGTIDVGSLSSGTYTVDEGTTLRMSGGAIGAGRSVIINAPASQVIIEGDIQYTGGALTSVEAIPQLVIIANDISIQGDVETVDAWLVASGASGTIDTCNDVAITASLTDSICNQQLTINGPVVAKQLYLKRTFGSGAGAQSGIPAEIINLRPDAYLWGALQAANSGRLQAVYETELPPRF